MDKEQITKELMPLEKSKAASIKKVFDPMVKMLEAMEDEYNKVVEMEINHETCGIARGLRLRISKVRIDADKLRIEQKKEYNIAGNAIQGVFNILKYAVTEKEDKLKEIEEFYERQEQKRIEGIKDKRVKLLDQFNIDGSLMDLGNMAEDVWDNYFTGVKTTYEKEQAEQKEITEAQLKRDEQFRIMELRKTELMPYAQFNPFMDLYPETPEEEYQDLLMRMKKAKFDFDEEQKKFAEEQKKTEAENERLRKENEENKKKLESVKGLTKGTQEIAENIKRTVQENIKEKLRIQNESKALNDEKDKLRKEKEEFKKKALSGLLGNKKTPITKNETNKKVSEKELLTSLSNDIYNNIELVKSDAAKNAITAASNTLKMAAMML